MALRNGSRFAVSMANVFPDGSYLVPDSFSEVQDYDEKTKTRRPSVDKVARRASGRRTCPATIQPATWRLPSYRIFPGGTRSPGTSTRSGRM
jgi:hypothetical protein